MLKSFILIWKTKIRHSSFNNDNVKANITIDEKGFRILKFKKIIQF